MRHLLLSLTIAASIGCSTKSTVEPVRHSDPRIESLVATGAIVLDVRSAEEFASGHVREALNIPYDRISQAGSDFESKKAKPIVVYCRTGRRAEIARQSLLRQGFTQVINAGGFDDIQRDLRREKTTD